MLRQFKPLAVFSEILRCLGALLQVVRVEAFAAETEHLVEHRVFDGLVLGPHWHKERLTSEQLEHLHIEMTVRWGTM